MQHVAPDLVAERFDGKLRLALVAQHFIDRRTAFFGHVEARLADAHDVHLKSLDQKVLGIPAVRTRKRHISHSIGIARGGRKELWRTARSGLFLVVVEEFEDVAKAQHLALGVS